MGATNVTEVFTYWTHSGLTHRETLALVYMAKTAMDTDNPPVYFGGWDMIADALSLDGDAIRRGRDPVGTAEEQKKAKQVAKSAEEQVRRVFAALGNAGAVVSGGGARKTVSADYALALKPTHTFQPTGKHRHESGRLATTWKRVERATDSTEKVGQESTEKVGLIPPKEWGKVHRKGGYSPTEKAGPRSTEEPLEEYGEDQSIVDAFVSPEGGEKKASDDDESNSIHQENRSIEWQSEQLVRMQQEFERSQESERKAS